MTRHLRFICRELLTLPDGGQVALDWVHNEVSTIPSNSRPVVVILPGLVGQSISSSLDNILRQMWYFIFLVDSFTDEFQVVTEPYNNKHDKCVPLMSGYLQFILNLTVSELIWCFQIRAGVDRQNIAIESWKGFTIFDRSQICAIAIFKKL